MSFRWRESSWLTKVLAAACVAVLAAPAAASAQSGKLDRAMQKRAEAQTGHSRVILVLKPGVDPSAHVSSLGGRIAKRLGLIDALVIELPDAQLRKLAEHSGILSIHHDRPVSGHASREAVTIGAHAVRQSFGYDGAGVGVAVIDSGITAWHDDLTYNGTSTAVRTVGGQRVTAFVDFVNGQLSPYDDNGHGTHVAGIVAGNGYQSGGARAGVAPGAHLVSLKVLDRR